MIIGRGAIRCRLIALRLDPKRAAANRRHIRSEAKRRGCGEPRKESLVRAGWRIIITHLDPGQMTADMISDL